MVSVVVEAKLLLLCWLCDRLARPKCRLPSTRGGRIVCDGVLLVVSVVIEAELLLLCWLRDRLARLECRLPSGLALEPRLCGRWGGISRKWRVSRWAWRRLGWSWLRRTSHGTLEPIPMVLFFPLRGLQIALWLGPAYSGWVYGTWRYRAAAESSSSSTGVAYEMGS